MVVIKLLGGNYTLNNTKLAGVILVLIITSFFSAVVISQRIKNRYLRTHNPTATILTDRGNIKIRFRESSPRTVENFINLATSGFYDNSRVYRVVPDLLIEMGDPQSKFEDKKLDWGKGGAKYYFPDEITPNDRMVRGIVAMVNSGPDTNSSKFFILTKDALWLNGKNTIFGDVEMGMEIVDNISSSDVGLTGIPVSEIKVIKVEIN